MARSGTPIGRKVPIKTWQDKRDNWDPEYESASYDRGYYERSAREYERALPAFQEWLRGFRPNSICDMGCGPGTWVRAFLAEMPVWGIDIGDGAGYDLPPTAFRRADLSRPLWDQLAPFHADIVMSLEVFEHVPKQHEQTFIDNLLAPDPRVLVFSVAIPGQWGRHHYNCVPVEYVQQLVTERGYSVDAAAAAPVRTMKYLASYYRRHLTVFRRPAQP
jgi:cyclopropane fatty-acyl-phospholipid synthase-like methyltransferase